MPIRTYENTGVGFEVAKQTIIDALEKRYESAYKEACEAYKAIQAVKELI